MASLEHQPGQRPTSFPPRCQKRSCPHRHCLHQGCNHNCPNVFWCPQCTRFWCDDCWEEVDAHEPIEMEVAGMKVHEKTIPKVADGVKRVLHFKETISENGATNPCLVARQGQGNVEQALDTSGTTPNRVDQAKESTAKRRWTEETGSSTPPSSSLNWALQDYQMQLMARQAQENTAKAPEDQSEQGTPKTEQPRSPTPSGATQHWATQAYQMQQILLEQQNKRRLLMAQQEQDKNK